VRRAIATAFIAVSVAASCATPAPTPSAAPAASASVAAPSPSPSPTAARSAPATPIASGAVAIDAGLLAHLPPTIDGLTVQRVPESDAIAQTDPLVVGNARAAVTALVIDAPEFAHATLVEVRPGIFGDAFFRKWRDTFDTSVCEPAGGIAGRAESVIAGRNTFIDSCVQGARTYYVWLEHSSILASVTSVGERRLGEKLVAALTD
jgi:hypothetical protein